LGSPLVEFHHVIGSPIQLRKLQVHFPAPTWGQAAGCFGLLHQLRNAPELGQPYESCHGHRGSRCPDVAHAFDPSRLWTQGHEMVASLAQTRLSG